MTRWQELMDLARRSLSSVVDRLLKLEALVAELQAQIKELKGRLAKNSRNSSQPPASDGLAKPAPKSLRRRSGRKPGGQPGHVGKTLAPVAQPNHTFIHRLGKCPCGQCAGRSLLREPVLDYEERQVFELPPQLLEVTAHRAEIKICPVSGLCVRAEFPEAVQAPVQYGPRFKSVMVYLSSEHLIPYDRLGRLVQDVFGQPLSEATVIAAQERVYRHLEPFEKELAEQLVQAALVHLDESGVRVAGKLHWLHVASTERLTFYGIHRQRGVTAMDFFDIVPRCRGWVIHDHYPSYMQYENCLHAFCNEHHLRELKFQWEEHGEAWAEELSQFLLQQKKERAERGLPSAWKFKKIRAEYHAILAKGRHKHPRRLTRAAQSKAGNLLDRLEDYDLGVLAFLIDPVVPFTNNQAEQDIRMIKIRQKISGGFRTLHGACVFARIRSYISTCRKQGRNILEALEHAFRGTPFLPALPGSGP